MENWAAAEFSFPIILRERELGGRLVILFLSLVGTKKWGTI
jgi:hypothetical protein